MADKITVELEAHLASAGRDIKTLKESGADKNIQNATRDFNELTKKIGDLLKVTNPTKRQFREIESAFKELDALIKKVSDTVRTASKDLVETEKQIAQKSKELATANKKYEKLQATGTESGKLRKSYVTEQIKGITYKEGTAHEGKQVLADSFLKNGQQGKFDQYSDPAQAKAVFEKLQKTSLGLADEYQKADEAIATLKKELEDLNTKAQSQVKTGNDKIHAGATKRDTEVSQLVQQGINAQNVKLRAADPTVDVNASTQGIQKQSSTLGRAIKQFSIYAIAIRFARRALREAVRTIKEVDRALTEQAMVTGLTRKQTYGLLKDYQQMAARLGTTTKEISSTMTQFLRQGRSLNEATQLTEAAVSAAKVAGISAADSINYLTTAVNGFRLSAEDAMKVSDKFAAVAATAATSYEEIAIALSKVAAQANLAGMSIDYTTALLTKGIETTREAPETIGTALKTVIARMREMTDYGETLEGDTNINNVESQLAYIGIQLRDTNGELRSTEDVLNDLGKQWDDLNANQQAAIAKALAGTRQQSRLIAMMQDYERVTELQQIAERSSGATMAQMATYMEGMDAALNKVRNSWEQIVSTIADSDTIINMIDGVANLLSGINNFLSNQVTLWGTIITLGLISATQLITKHEKQKAVNRSILEQQKYQRQVVIQEKEAYAQQLRAFLQAGRNNKEEKKKLRTIYQQNLALAEANKDYGARAKYTALIAELDASAGITDKERLHAQQELGLVEAEITGLQMEQRVTTLNIMKNGAGFSEYLGKALSVLTPILSIMTMMNTVQQAINRKKIESIALEKTEQKEKVKTGLFAKIKAAWEMAGSAANIPVAGWVIAGVILATILGVSIAVAASSMKAANSSEKTVDSINELSKKIYDLNKKTTGLDSVIDKFDKLDQKILKTNKDVEEMNSLLESAADSLTDKEKETFQSITTTAEKRRYIEQVRNEAAAELAVARARQAEEVKRLRKSSGWNNFKNSTRSEDVQAKDAIYALNNANLYALIDDTDNLNEGTEKLIQSLLEELDLEEAVALLQDPDRIKDYIDQVQDGVDVFMDESKSIRERVEAYEKLRDSLTDPEMRDALKSAYSEWETFANEMSSSSLDFIDSVGASVDKINSLGDAIHKLGYDTEDTTDKLDDLFTQLQEGTNIKDAITDIFNVSADSEEYKSILDAYDKSFGTTILNMGQNIDKFKNTIDSFYEKATEWATMSETDKTSFISENSLLFQGEDGDRLLRAFESANYAEIEAALASNKQLTDQRARLLADVDRQLQIELARSEEERNYAYIQELQEYKKQLEDLDKIYLASLKRRYDQQQAQLDAYKDYLQKETDALTEALDKRKEAYEKYFEAINREYEEEEYEEQARLLVANISKLGSSMNADAAAKRADLAQQLDELEKERLKTLREQAQEDMIKSIEDQVSQINDNLEKLLNNEQALLTAMTNDAQNPSQMIASLMSAQFASGNNTELGMQNYLQQMQATFAAIMPNVDWSNVDVERQGDSLILNIMGKQVQLTDGEQQTVYDAIQSALRQLGYN